MVTKIEIVDTSAGIFGEVVEVIDLTSGGTFDLGTFLTNYKGFLAPLNLRYVEEI